MTEVISAKTEEEEKEDLIHEEIASLEKAQGWFNKISLSINTNNDA